MSPNPQHEFVESAEDACWLFEDAAFDADPFQPIDSGKKDSRTIEQPDELPLWVAEWSLFAVGVECEANLILIVGDKATQQPCEVHGDMVDLHGTEVNDATHFFIPEEEVIVPEITNARLQVDDQRAGHLQGLGKRMTGGAETGEQEFAAAVNFRIGPAADGLGELSQSTLFEPLNHFSSPQDGGHRSAMRSEPREFADGLVEFGQGMHGIPQAIRGRSGMEVGLARDPGHKFVTTFRGL